MTLKQPILLELFQILFACDVSINKANSFNAQLKILGDKLVLTLN